MMLITSITSAHYVDEDDYDLIMERVRQRRQLQWLDSTDHHNHTSSLMRRQKRSISFAELDSLDNYESEGNCILSNDTLAKVNILQFVSSSA